MTIASVLLTTAMWATAQQPTEPASVVLDRRAMAENIEVFRQVLRRRLARPASWGRAPSGQGLMYAEPAAAGQHYLGRVLEYGASSMTAPGMEPIVEGVYLPGYGAVFTTTLPAALRDGRPADEKPAAKSLSDWERAQMELRGEKPDPAVQTDSRPPSIRDVLLGVLADNGRHLSQLRDNEKVTIVVTFRDSGGSLATPGILSTPNWVPRGTSSTINVAPLAAVAPPAPPLPTTARDYEILADLHLKQQQFQAASESYSKAIAAYQDDSKASGDQAKDLAPLYARQAQALLALGRIDAAKELLKKADETTAAKPGTPATREQKLLTLPARLIVSATKRQLDQVGQGQLSFDDFRKAAMIDEQ